MGRNKPPHCIGPKVTVPQPSVSIRGQQQVVRTRIMSWHSQSSTISNRSCERTALAHDSLLTFLRSSFNHVPQNSVVPAQHLNMLRSTYPNHVISMLMLYWRHGHHLDIEIVLVVFSALVL